MEPLQTAIVLLVFIIITLVLVLLTMIACSRVEAPKRGRGVRVEGYIMTGENEPESSVMDVVVMVGRMETSGDKLMFVPATDENDRIIIARTDHQGKFVIESMPPGTFWFKAEKPGFRPLLKMIHIEAGKTNFIQGLVLSR